MRSTGGNIEITDQLLSSAALEVDKALAGFDAELDWLTRFTPNNLSDVQSGFVKSGFRVVPALSYDPMTLDLEDIRRRLFALPVHDIDNPHLEVLLTEKQREIDQQIDLVRLRDKEGIIAASLNLFGGVSDQLLQQALDILRTVPKGTDAPADCSAEQFVTIAQTELDWYHEQDSSFDFKVLLDEPGGSLMTSGGHLLVSSDYTVAKSRIMPLIQHEIGTHTVTRHNGRKQPLHVLRCGLPDYDALQEGLAVLGEYLCGNLPPGRLRMLAGRVVAADMAVRQKSPETIFHKLFEQHGFDEGRAFDTAIRAVRGGGLTKDALYLRGLVQLMAYLGNGGDFEKLFIGKFALSQLPVLEKLMDSQLLAPPTLLPRYLQNPEAHARLAKVRSMSISQLYQESPQS